MSRLAGAPRTTVVRSSIRYAAGPAFAHLLSVAEVLIILVALGGHTLGALHPHFSAKYVLTAVTVVVLGTFTVFADVVPLAIPSLRRFVPGTHPLCHPRESPRAGGRRNSRPQREKTWWN